MSTPRVHLLPPDKQEKLRAHWRKRARDRRAGLRSRSDNKRAAFRPTVSEEQQAEQQVQYTAPRTLTAEFFGDPLPGRSALDRRQS